MRTWWPICNYRQSRSHHRFPELVIHHVVFLESHALLEETDHTDQSVQGWQYNVVVSYRFICIMVLEALVHGGGWEGNIWVWVNSGNNIQLPSLNDGAMTCLSLGTAKVKVKQDLFDNAFFWYWYVSEKWPRFLPALLLVMVFTMPTLAPGTTLRASGMVQVWYLEREVRKWEWNRHIHRLIKFSHP